MDFDSIAKSVFFELIVVVEAEGLYDACEGEGERETVMCLR